MSFWVHQDVESISVQGLRVYLDPSPFVRLLRFLIPNKIRSSTKVLHSRAKVIRVFTLNLEKPMPSHVP